MKNWTAFLFVLFSIIIFSTCENRYNNTVFVDWDENEDLEISAEEFEVGYGDAYFAAWDVDGDGTITVAEWNDGIEVFYTVEDPDMNFAEMDINTNDQVSRDEFIDGSFAVWDMDTDGHISRQEFNTFYYDLEE